MKKIVIALFLVLLMIAVITVNALTMKNTTDRMLQHMDAAVVNMKKQAFDSAKQDMDALLGVIEDKRIYFGLVTSKENLEELEDSARRAAEYCCADAQDEYYAEISVLRHHIEHMLAYECFSLHTIL